MSLLHIAISIALVIGLIVLIHVDAVLALAVGAGYLGVATGQGLQGTLDLIASGFGSLLGEIGLILAFGVLLGFLLQYIGLTGTLADLLCRKVHPKPLPYVMGGSLNVFFSSIQAEVLSVLASPLTHSTGRLLGRNGHGKLSGATIVGMVVGTMFMVPGAGVVVLAGLMDVSLGKALAVGAPLGLATTLVTIAIFNLLAGAGMWKPVTDEIQSTGELESVPIESASSKEGNRHEQVRPVAGRRAAADSSSFSAAQAKSAGSRLADEQEPNQSDIGRKPPLLLSMAPLIVILGLISSGPLCEALGTKSAVVAFISNPVLALFVGLSLAYMMARGFVGRKATNEALSKGYAQCGSILVLTGMSGGLAAVVRGSGADKVLSEWFTSGMLSPLLLTWLIAAILHMAIGSVMVGAFTAIGVVAPALGPVDVDPVLVMFAAASGGMFLGLVNANAFWLFQVVFGLTTKGTFKAYSLSLSIASFVSLALILVLDLIM